MHALRVLGLARHPRGRCAPPDLRKSDGCVPTTLTKRLNQTISQTAILAHQLLWTFHGHLEESTWQAQLLALMYSSGRHSANYDSFEWLALPPLFFAIQIAVNSAGFCSHLPKLLDQQFLMPSTRPMIGAYIKSSICMSNDGRFGNPLFAWGSALLGGKENLATLPPFWLCKHAAWFTFQTLQGFAWWPTSGRPTKRVLMNGFFLPSFDHHHPYHNRLIWWAAAEATEAVAEANTVAVAATLAAEMRKWLGPKW